VALASGTRFGPYEVVEQIGSGGMGEVWRARDTNLKRDVAVKVLPESFAADADRLARFQREAEVLASLNHPNIATIHGLEQANGQTVIVMELVEGPTLADRIAEGPISPDEALGIARQVVDALEVAHGRQIVHRDLKPANIKLKDDGTIKVLDFGISKPIDASAISGGSPVMTTPAMTEAGVILGTAAYMSPEQARGRFVDQRTDIWAFGCLLFEMLTGQPAFGGEDVMATLARVIDRDTDISSLPGTISPAVRRTIKLCLEKDPRKRIADIRDVRLALAGEFETERVLVPETTVRPRKPIWRRSLPVIVSAALAVIATLLISAQLTRSSTAEVRRFVYSLPEGQRLNNPVLPMLAVSPDGRGFVYSANGALYLRLFSELGARIVPGTEGEIPITPVFSPDGDRVLFESGSDGVLKAVPISGGSPLRLVPEVPNTGWRWPQADAILYGEQSDCRIRRVSLKGNDPTVVASDPGFGCYEPTLLPDGNLLLYERRQGGSTIEVAVLSVATGESTGLFPGKQPHYFEPGYLVYFDVTSGLVGRTFNPSTLEYGNPVVLSDDIFMATPTGGVQFAVSRRGDLVYMVGARASEESRTLAIADESGQVSLLNVPAMPYSYPSVSPDANAVAVQVGTGNDAQIYVYDLHGDAEIRQLTYAGSNATPSWSPDGAWITYSSDRDGRTRIYRQRADGSGVAEALTDPAENDTQNEKPVWAPDGRLTYVEVDGRGSPTLKIKSIPDGSAEDLVAPEFQPFSIAFSTDGHAMAYSAQAGDFQVFAEPFPPDGSRTRLSEEGGSGAAWPVWSREGSRVRFQTGNSGYSGIDVDTGNFSIRNRRSVPLPNSPNDRWHDSMPGTDQFLIVTLPNPGNQTQSTSEQLVVVENWIEELKDRVPLD
jgi:serine/threonine protein kinase/Tol biopolymer transport system component